MLEADRLKADRLTADQLTAAQHRGELGAVRGGSARAREAGPDAGQAGGERAS
jgi:hypothetical protein